MSTLFIEELRIDTVVGVADAERTRTQPLLIDLELTVDVTTPGLTDALDDATNIAAVCNRVTDVVSASRFRLIETVARIVGELLHKEFGVVSYRVTVTKPEAVDNARAVGVSIEGP